MPKITKKLIEAFNSNNRFYRIIDTNLILESRWNGDFIVIKFDKNMNAEQCTSYMNDFKSKVIKRFYETEDDADIAFDIKSFPFNLRRGKLQHSNKGMKYVVPVNEGTVFNLKCYLMSSFARRTEEKLGKIFGVRHMNSSTGAVEFDRRHYLYCTDFGNEEIRNKFRELFRLDIESHDNVPSSLFEVEGNCVYIKDIFKNNIPLINSMIERDLWLIGRHLRIPNNKDKYVEVIKDRIIDLIYAELGLLVYGVFRAPYLGSEENSVLIPVVLGTDGKFRWLTQGEAKNINKVFGYSVLNNVNKCITKEQLTELLGEDYKKGVYGINFYDKEISYCVLSKIMESSIINKDHELAIDPELVRALSPAQSPVRVPNGYLNEAQLESPTCSRKKLEGFTRQGSEKEGPLYNHVDVPGTGGRCSPSSQVNSIAVNRVIEPKKCVGAAENVPASTNLWTQQPNPLSFPVFYAQSSDISVLRFQPPTPLSSSGPSSWEVAVQNVSAALSQDLWSF